jgi:hypothetical protein
MLSIDAFVKKQRVTADPILPDDLDIGYLVLLDKDGRISSPPAPSESGYWASLPTRGSF